MATTRIPIYPSAFAFIFPNPFCSVLAFFPNEMNHFTENGIQYHPIPFAELSRKKSPSAFILLNLAYSA